MVTSLVTLVTVALVVAAHAAPSAGTDDATTIINTIIEKFDQDDFSKVQTVGGEDDSTRKRRSLGQCGAAPAQRTTFVRCFAPSNVAVQPQRLVRNYYRQGDYGQCLNYFRSLPLSNVNRIATGYTGQLTTTTGRSYTVSACQRCYAGQPGISVRGVNRPESGLVRNFIFRPQINNINYNTYVSPASSGSGYGYGSSPVYVEDAGFSGGAGYVGGGGYYSTGNSYGMGYGGYQGYGSYGYNSGSGYIGGVGTGYGSGVVPQGNVVYTTGGAGASSSGAGYTGGANIVNIGGGQPSSGGFVSGGAGSGIIDGVGSGGIIGGGPVMVETPSVVQGSTGGHGCTVNCS